MFGLRQFRQSRRAPVLERNSPRQKSRSACCSWERKIVQERCAAMVNFPSVIANFSDRVVVTP